MWKAEQSARQEVRDVHHDVEDIVSREDFNMWINADNYRTMLNNSKTAPNLINLLDMWKAEQERREREQKERQEQARREQARSEQARARREQARREQAQNPRQGQNDSRHFQTLGLPTTATWEEIKDAHKRLARQWHPDKNPTNIEEATERFKAIQGAYEKLKIKLKKGGRRSKRKNKK